MSLNAIMNIATSGMNVAQTQLRVVSDNVSNVNTPGYIRKIADQESRATQGVGSGVIISRVRLATDRFLQVASLNAASDVSNNAVQFELFQSVQALFGDPRAGGFFGKVDDMFASFMKTAEDATSGPLRQEALYKLRTMLEDAGRISRGIQDVRADADSRLVNVVARTNELLIDIETLNNEIAKAQVSGADATGAQTAQNALVTELAGMMDIRLSSRSMGGIEIRTGTGILLAGKGAAQLSYLPAGSVTAASSFKDIIVQEPGGNQQSLTSNLLSGEIKGLLNIRDVEAPQAAERMAEMTARLADELNRAHNAATSHPAPNVLTGRNTGQSLTNALAGFNGVTTVAVLDAQGVVRHQADIVFSPAGITINGQVTTADNFLANLSGALGNGASATFVNGALTIAAGPGEGIAISQPETGGSQKAGRGFSHFFGLNDLVRSTDVTFYETGLMADSVHGFGAGETIGFRLVDDQGRKIRDLEFTIPPGATTMSQLQAALNDPISGLGRHGSFELGATGELVFSGSGEPRARLTVLDDRTRQADSGVSMSELFGLGGTRADRPSGYAIRDDIVRDGSFLALGKLDTTVAPGTAAISVNDGRGGQALANVYQKVTAFSPAGSAGAVSMTLARYASELSGDLGTRSASFKSRADSAVLIRTEVDARRNSVEGVNLDEELVNLTTFQQAYNASARMIQAVSEMYDTLLGMVR